PQLPASARHLPSVPTRRSSDLDPEPQRRLGRLIEKNAEAFVVAGDGADQGQLRRRDLLLPWRRRRPDRRLFGDRGWRRPPRWREDRKSTRLNSSHQIISYAVFC